ncbi:MAG TPA: M81 family metallopeptidase [Burkholderiaceae bacterium]|nr:M81 family metallopeptidase [Burkholderiaceae bacterium]
MRMFAASIGTETNTFSPIPTALESFYESFYAPPGQHPDDAKLCTAPVWVARRRARAEGWTLIEGSCSFAEPAGLVSREAYETLRDEVLGQLRAAMPVDAVVLGLHGAMVADGYDDCEGDLIESVRNIVGAKVPIGVELDPHCHMTRRRVANATLIICFKEFPHTDFVARGEEVVELTLRAARGEITPVMSLVDCRMIGSFPTTLQPMRGFVDRISAMEGKNGVLSISLAHCFPYADVPEMGSRVLVVTDNLRAAGDALALELANEFFGMRGKTQPAYVDPDGAIDIALKEAGTVVVADPSDNPGGGAPGDSTMILRRMIERGVTNAALAPIWDPVAVRMCFMAGVGGKLPLRFGGKTAPTSGQPIDALVTVTQLTRDATQTFVGAEVPLGDCAAISVNGISVVLITKRTQALGSDLLTGMGVAIEGKKMVVLKSTNHFHAAFAPFASRVVYCDASGPIPRDHRKVPYTRVQRPIWPLDDQVSPVLLA